MLALKNRTLRTDFWKGLVLHSGLCRLIFLAIISFAVPTSPLLAVDYFYQSGDATLLASWNTILAGGGATPANFTTATDRFLVPSGRTAVITANLTLGAGVILQVQT